MKTIKRLTNTLLATLFPVISYAQIKLGSLTEIEQKFKEGSDSVITIGDYIIGAIIVIGFGTTIYTVVTKSPHVKEAVLCLLTGIILAILKNTVI